MISRSPWNDEQISKLQNRQANATYHPYICGLCDNHIELVPTKDGWNCPQCNKVTQDWCHEYDIA